MSDKSPITTHVLDTSQGRPAAGVPVSLELKAASGEWTPLGQGETDADGRLSTLLKPGSRPMKGKYRLVFDTYAYFQNGGTASFYPSVEVVFEVADPAQHYHVPLLLSPYGYSTYRGS